MKKYFFTFLLTVFVYASSVPAQVQSRNEVNGKSAYIMGIEAFVNEDFETAREYLLQAYKNLGEAAGVTFALADTYFMLGDLPNAALYGKKAVAGEPDSKWYRIKLAEIYRHAGKNDATLSELTTLLEYHPKDFEALFMLADTYEHYGELVKANTVFDRILKITGPDINVYLSKLQNFEKLGLPDSALAVLEKIREADPDNLYTLNLLGEYYSKTGYDGEAKGVLDEALSRNSRDPQTLINLAGIFLEEQKWDSAGTLLSAFVADSLVKAEEKLRISQFVYSHVQQQPDNQKLLSQAENILESFTVHEPDYGPAYTISGQFYAETGKNEKALYYLQKANELLPQDDIAWRQRIQLLVSENKLQEAISTGIKADEYVPDDAFIQFFIGSAYMLLEEYNEAQKWLEKASRAPARRPFKSVIYSSLGDVQAGKGNDEAADDAYEFALRYDPENYNAMNSYAFHLAERSLKLEKAEELILKALDANPKHASYLDTAGWVYYKLGNYEKALNYLQAAVKTGEANAVAFEHLGDLFDKLDKPAEARKWWKKAYEMDSSKTHLQSKL